MYFYSIRKNPYDRILKWKPKEQHLNIVPKSCPSIIPSSNSIKVTFLFYLSFLLLFFFFLIYILYKSNLINIINFSHKNVFKNLRWRIKFFSFKMERWFWNSFLWVYITLQSNSNLGLKSLITDALSAFPHW